MNATQPNKHNMLWQHRTVTKERRGCWEMGGAKTDTQRGTVRSESVFPAPPDLTAVGWVPFLLAHAVSHLYLLAVVLCPD